LFVGQNLSSLRKDHKDDDDGKYWMMMRYTKSHIAIYFPLLQTAWMESASSSSPQKAIMSLEDSPSSCKTQLLLRLLFPTTTIFSVQLPLEACMKL
jgi:hypothetical protein